MIGFAFSKTCSGPPTIKVRVPACAGGMPPDTGASRNFADGADSRTTFRTSNEALASIVDVSKNRISLSFLHPVKRPLEGSRKTVFTAAAFGKDVMIISFDRTR